MENQVFGAKWDSRTWASGGNKNFKEKTRAPLDPGRKKMNKEEIREENGVGGFPGGSDGKESACNVGDPSSIPGPGRSPGEGNGNPLQYTCLENSMD